MYNLTRALARTLPTFEVLNNHEFKVVGIRVKRPTYSVLYHRTDRGLRGLQELNLDVSLFKATRSSILDLGCGDGKLVTELSGLGYQIHGADLYLNENQERSPLFIQADAFQLPMESMSYDLILSTWSVFSFEPVAQMGALLTQAARVLRPGGAILMAPITEEDRIYAIQKAAMRLGLKIRMNPKTGLIRCEK